MEGQLGRPKSRLSSVGEVDEGPDQEMDTQPKGPRTGRLPGLLPPSPRGRGRSPGSLVRKGLMAPQMPQHRHRLGSWGAR